MKLPQTYYIQMDIEQSKLKNSMFSHTEFQNRNRNFKSCVGILLNIRMYPPTS